MTYISDSQRIELALPPFLALSVLISGAADPNEPGVVEAKQLFWTAHFEPFDGLDQKKRHALMRRCERTRDEIMREYEQAETRVCKFGLIVYHVLKILTDSDYLVLPPESAMSRGLDLLLPALEEEAAIGAVDASAHKQARKVIEKLNRLGFYHGVLDARHAAE